MSIHVTLNYLDICIIFIICKLILMIENNFNFLPSKLSLRASCLAVRFIAPAGIVCT